MVWSNRRSHDVVVGPGMRLNLRAAAAMVSAARVRSSGVWARVTERRRRAVPWGTVGGRTATARMSFSVSFSARARAASLSPMCSGRMGEAGAVQKVSGMAKPWARRARAKPAEAASRRGPRSGVLHDDFGGGERGGDDGRGEGGGVDERAGAVDEEVAHLLGAGDEAAVAAQRLAERADDEVGLEVGRVERGAGAGAGQWGGTVVGRRGGRGCRWRGLRRRG